MEKLIEKNLKRIARKEDAFLQKNGGEVWKPVTGKLEEKIPPGVYEKLQKAFYLGFKTVFEKGNIIIERTYDREEMQIHHRVYDETAHLVNARKGLRGLNRLAERSNLRNLGLTAIEGSGLGLLGIGLPDIPIFIGVVLKSIYEIALSYGYDYRQEDERYFILKLMEAALAPQETCREANERIDRLIGYYVRGVPLGYDPDEQLRNTADAFAADMLCLKFIQGLPLIGIVGGATNVLYCRKISAYAQLKYQKRYLLQQQYRLEQGTALEKIAENPDSKEDGHSVS